MASTFTLERSVREIWPPAVSWVRMTSTRSLGTMKPPEAETCDDRESRRRACPSRGPRRGSPDRRAPASCSRIGSPGKNSKRATAPASSVGRVGHGVDGDVVRRAPRSPASRCHSTLSGDSRSATPIATLATSIWVRGRLNDFDDLRRGLRATAASGEPGREAAGQKRHHEQDDTRGSHHQLRLNRRRENAGLHRVATMSGKGKGLVNRNFAETVKTLLLSIKVSGDEVLEDARSRNR